MPSGENGVPNQAALLPYIGIVRASLIAHLVKNPPAMPETPVWFLGQEDVLEKG